MDTFALRMYKGKHVKGEKEANNKPAFPFWDFRSRRGLNTSLPSNCGSSASSMNSTKSESEVDDSSFYSSGSSDLSQTADPFRLTLEVVEYEENIGFLWDLLQPLFETVDGDLKLLNLTERSPYEDGYTTGDFTGRNWVKRKSREDLKMNSSFYKNNKYKCKSNVNLNSSVVDTSHYENCGTESCEQLALSVMLFLFEDKESLGGGSFCSARKYLGQSPWMYHHSDNIPNDLFAIYPQNNTDYYVINEDLPLWSIRQVHCGKEHVRFQTSSSYENWKDNLDFYQLIIGYEPDLNRPDFSLYTLYSQQTYDVQFSLKRLPTDVTVEPLRYCRLQFRVTDIGRLVPLFPNVCTPISDTRWKTTDHDGNTVIVQTVGNRNYRSSSSSFSTDESSLLGFYV